MRTALLWSLLPGCIVPGTTPDDTPGRNGLGLRMALVPYEEPMDTGEIGDTGDTGEAEEPSTGVERLQLVLAEVRFTGSLSGEPVETTDGTSRTVELQGGTGLASLPTLSLQEGVYIDARYEVRVASLVLEAQFEEESVRLEVDTPLTWFAETSEFLLPDGPDPVVTFELDPLAWLDTISLDDAEPDDEGDYVFSSSSNPKLFAELRADLIDATEGKFPEGLE